MPTAIIADDEPFMRDSLKEHLQDLWPQLEIIAEAEDGPSALIKIESMRPDISFLDIRMPGLTGLQVAKSITVPTKIVFVTAYDSHAVEAFEANAIDYVLKPLDTARLAKVVSKLIKATHHDFSNRPIAVHAGHLLSSISSALDHCSATNQTNDECGQEIAGM
ncbi:MAG: response regulator [Rhodoferax sp.]